MMDLRDRKRAITRKRQSQKYVKQNTQTVLNLFIFWLDKSSENFRIFGLSF